MTTFLTIIHVIVCIFLILVVLLQQGKGADLSGAFGGGGTQTTFGARTPATLLTRATTVAAVLFMLTSLALTILISRPGSSSVIRDDAVVPVTQPAPAPAETPAQPPAESPASPAETPGQQPAPANPATPNPDQN